MRLFRLYALFLAGFVFAAVFLPGTALAQRRNEAAEAAEAATGCAVCGTCGAIYFVVIVGVIALHIAILVWVARDAKSRGMDSAVLWMLLVLFTGVIGLIIYVLARPQGNLIECPHCQNKRLQASARCPHCANP